MSNTKSEKSLPRRRGGAIDCSSRPQVQRKDFCLWITTLAAADGKSPSIWSRSVRPRTAHPRCPHRRIIKRTRSNNTANRGDPRGNLGSQKTGGKLVECRPRTERLARSGQPGGCCSSRPPERITQQALQLTASPPWRHKRPAQQNAPFDRETVDYCPKMSKLPLMSSRFPGGPSYPTKFPPVQPRERRIIEALTGKKLNVRWENAVTPRLSAWCLRVCPRLGKLLIAHPDVLRDGPWRFGPRIESRLPGEPVAVLDALRVNGRRMRLEVSITHHFDPPKSAQVNDAQQVGAIVNITDKVRKNAQLAHLEWLTKVDFRGCSNSGAQAVAGAGSDPLADAAGCRRPPPPTAQDEPTTQSGGIAGVPAIGAPITRIRPCATHESEAEREFDDGRDREWGRDVHWKSGKKPVWDAIAREAAEVEAGEVRAFEDSGSELDENELREFERVMVEWVGMQGGRGRKWALVRWFSGLVRRLRVMAGCVGDEILRREALDAIGYELAGEGVTGEFGSLERLSPGVAEVRIVRSVDLREGRVRWFRFVDQETGAVEERAYTMEGGDVKQVGVPGMSWEEDYAMRLIKVILDEASR